MEKLHTFRFQGVMEINEAFEIGWFLNDDTNEPDFNSIYLTFYKTTSQGEVLFSWDNPEWIRKFFKKLKKFSKYNKSTLLRKLVQFEVDGYYIGEKEIMATTKHKKALLEAYKYLRKHYNYGK